jgi:pimeloyl-ACP methyl ester carboxylesterase
MPGPPPLEHRSVVVDGNEIRYRVSGPVDAPPMVHVHGFAISGRYLLPTAALLANDFRTYIPDLPGFGQSPKPPQPLGITELGAALDGFLTALGVERATFVANSLGCAITAELIDAAPARVERAIMVGLAGGRQNRPLPRALLQMATDGLREPPRLLPVVAPDYLRFGPVRALRLFSLMTKFPAYERFLSVSVPTMVVIGSEDPLRPSWKRISAVMTDIPDDVTIVLFQGAAHAINFTHPRELASAIRQYVAGEEVRMDAANPGGLPVLELKRPT